MECAGPGCEKVGENACSRCLSVAYCGPVCQRADWDGGHKGQCKKLAAERAAEEAAQEGARAANLKGGGGNGGGGPPQTFDGLSVKQLKELLCERGISTSGMTERHELVSALAAGPFSGGGGGGGLLPVAQLPLAVEGVGALQRPPRLPEGAFVLPAALPPPCSAACAAFATAPPPARGGTGGGAGTRLPARPRQRWQTGSSSRQPAWGTLPAFVPPSPRALP